MVAATFIWWQFREAIQSAPTVDVGRFVEAGCQRPMSYAVRKGAGHFLQEDAGEELAAAIAAFLEPT